MSGFFFRIVNADPLILVFPTGYAMEQALPYAARLAAGRATHILLSVNWYLPHQMQHLHEQAAWARAYAPNLHLIVMAPTAEDDAACREAGLDSFLCNHNCLVDEHVYRPDPAVERRFDAVYTGRLAPMKRHELAFDVPRLAVVSGTWDVDDVYVATLKAGFRDLAWSNHGAGEGEAAIRLLTPHETARILQASHCGLALSALEGAMFASAEYLLAGLPVVTTRSVGGRDVFFEASHVATVADDPAVVATAVAAFRAARLDPLAIRARTLALFRPHRMRLLLRVSAILQRNLFLEVDANLWHPLMAGKMRDWVSVD